MADDETIPSSQMNEWAMDWEGDSSQYEHSTNIHNILSPNHRSSPMHESLGRANHERAEVVRTSQSPVEETVTEQWADRIAETRRLLLLQWYCTFDIVCERLTKFSPR